MIEQEIEQARADLDQLDVEQLRCGVLLQLLHIEALKKAAQPEPGVKMVPIRQLFDANGIQVCDTGHESCHFYVPAIVPNFSASCNHTQRGIPDNKPHRLCPVLHESNK